MLTFSSNDKITHVLPNILGNYLGQNCAISDLPESILEAEKSRDNHEKFVLSHYKELCGIVNDDVDIILSKEKEEDFLERAAIFQSAVAIEEQDILEKITNLPISKPSINTGYDKKVKPSKKSDAKDIGDNITYQFLSDRLKAVVDFYCDDSQLRYYNGRYYEAVRKNTILKLYRMYVDESAAECKSLTIFRNLSEFILADSKINSFCPNDIFDTMVSLNNGVYDVVKGVLYPHNSKFILFHTINANFVEQPYAPVFEKFLHTISNGDEVLMNRIYEMIGYCMISSNKAKAFFVLGTKKNSGKSTLLNWLRTIFEFNSITSISLTDLNEKFSLQQLQNAHINIAADIDKSEVNSRSISKLKMITGNDLSTVWKMYEGAYSMQLRTKFIFATNHKFVLKHEDEALFNRLRLIPFENEIPVEQFDQNLLAKLERETDSIVSIALSHCRNLIENGYCFSSNAFIEEAENEWKSFNLEDSLDCFLEEKCMIGGGEEIVSSDQLFDSYVAFCNEKRIIQDIGSQSKFTSEIIKRNLGIVKTRKRVNGCNNPISCFRGIRIIDS